jgi:hypothetical protein
MVTQNVLVPNGKVMKSADFVNIKPNAIKHVPDRLENNYHELGT